MDSDSTTIGADNGTTSETTLEGSCVGNVMAGKRAMKFERSCEVVAVYATKKGH